MVLEMAYSLLYLLTLFLIFPFFSIAQTHGNITAGATLSASANSSDSWLSPHGDFAFGFSKFENNQFLLSIWYNKIPEKTIVWYANDGNFVESGSKVQLTSDKGLVLTSPNGKELWKSEPVIGTLSLAHMNDTGNFMIKDRNSGNLWESFDFPTDTILPFQIIERGRFLYSRKTERDFSPGRFCLTLLDTGNLVLSSVSLPTKNLDGPYYYQSNTYDGTNISNSGLSLVLNETGYLYIPRGNGENFILTEGDVFSGKNFYHRATINFDGVFIQYYRPKNSTKDETWTTIKAIPNNICLDMLLDTGTGVCGYNGICILGTDRRPTCKCPPRYSLLDSNDIYGGCKPDFALGCEYDGIQIKYDIEELQYTNWPGKDYAVFTPFTGSQCRDSCLNDCMCAVSAIYKTTCWKKGWPLLNGRMDSKVDVSTTYFKVGKVNSSVLSNVTSIKNDDKDSIIVAGSVLLGTSVLAHLVLAIAFSLGFFTIYKKKNVKNTQVESSLRCFTYKELVEATRGYKEELGRGAFGIVYKGEMRTGCGDFVAVKKLDRMIDEGEKEFRAEVDVIGQTHHKNLVRLLGFCNEGTNRLLVYEYMSNGTLSQFLFQNKVPSWKERIEIVFGIARGLVYLHEECVTQIIHCDIKPQNILLDNFQNARISDFGLAKLLDIGQSYTNTGIRGTKGYVAPEWFRNQPITVKVDVYSFGVLLLEIICCRKNVEHGNIEDTLILTDWVYDCYEEGRLDDVVGEDVEALGDAKTLHRFIMVALWCIQEDPRLRPSMRNVTHMLEGVVDVNLPSCPSLYSYTKS